MLWQLIENPDIPHDQFCPSPPHNNEWFTVRGTLTIDETLPAGERYKHSEENMLGKILTIIVQRHVCKNWGLRVYMQGRSKTGTWYLESTHTQNTLLNDVDFKYIVDKECVE